MPNYGQDVKALHLEGGNSFDDIRIDIAASHKRLANLRRYPRSIKKPKYRNTLKYHLVKAALRFRVYEFLVVNGIIGKWLDDFRVYWSTIIGGRPFWITADFFLLLHDYRKQSQHNSQLEWSNPAQHLANWQHPSQIFSTFHNVRKLAIQPLLPLEFWKRVPEGARILEYGCSLAPFYSCYREFYSHLDCKWVLADIPNFTFHYAKYLYRNDSRVDFVTIYECDFSNPLGEAGEFDIIILTTVFEHLDNPLFVFEYLLRRLKTGGLFVFDYIKSEGKGLDHPNAVKLRQECLKSILANMQILHGTIHDIYESVGFCIAQKKTPEIGLRLKLLWPGR
jgi:SAM-dependent methyltransferase